MSTSTTKFRSRRWCLTTLTLPSWLQLWTIFTSRTCPCACEWAIVTVTVASSLTLTLASTATLTQKKEKPYHTASTWQSKWESSSVSTVNMVRMIETPTGELFVKYGSEEKKPPIPIKTIQVPRFFTSLSPADIETEINFYSNNHDQWSQHIVLEIFYYAVHYATDHKPKDRAHENYDYDNDNDYRNHQQCVPNEEKGIVCDSGGIFDGTKNWLFDNVNVCDWGGITCGADPREFESKLDSDSKYRSPPAGAVSKIDLVGCELQGTLPSELYMLQHLHRLNLNDNNLQGTIPNAYGHFKQLQFVDFGLNKLTGTIPNELSLLRETLEELWLEKNELKGNFPTDLTQLSNCEFFDISGNKVEGTLPTEIGIMSKLGSLFIEGNEITGNIASEIGNLKRLKDLDFAANFMTGTLPPELGLCTALRGVNLMENNFTGPLPPELFSLTHLENLVLSDNQLIGHIVPFAETAEFGWSNLSNLLALAFDRNHFEGSIPPEFFSALGPSLTTLDIGFNRFTGTLPSTIGRMTNLERITAPANFFVGTLPSEMGMLSNLGQINLTSNQFTGTVPKELCDYSDEESTLMKQFGCDAILCPSGTYHPEGAASVHGGCSPCTSTRSSILGNIKCGTDTFKIGDVDGDGIVSSREVLRLLWIETDGAHWGEAFAPWYDMNVHACDLQGVICGGSGGNDIAKIDLTDASLCTDDLGEESVGRYACPGLPAELGLLTSLELLVLSGRHFLRGTIPSEIGKLQKLKYLDLSNCAKLTGSIPTEIGLMTSLRVLNLSATGLIGSIPESLYDLRGLEKLWLNSVTLTGTISKRIGNLEKLKEMMMSRAQLVGMIPEEIGDLTNLENLEFYGNELQGSIPSSIGNCVALKRIDLFNNLLTGTLPSSLGNIVVLQILHLKKNKFSGSIPSSLGELSFLVWLDLSTNALEGVIPESFSNLSYVKDLRLGSNKLHEPIPKNLCTNRVNGDFTASYGCDAILCPLGTYSELGFASEQIGCTMCPDGQTTMYLGSSICFQLSVEDVIGMFFEVMGAGDGKADYNRGRTDPACQWDGITCDDGGQIVSISFPSKSK